MTGFRSFLQLNERSWLGRLEAPFLEKVDVRLETVLLVLLVGDDLDLLQSLESRHGGWLGLNMDDLFVCLWLLV